RSTTTASGTTSFILSVRLAPAGRDAAPAHSSQRAPSRSLRPLLASLDLGYRVAETGVGGLELEAALVHALRLGRLAEGGVDEAELQVDVGLADPHGRVEVLKQHAAVDAARLLPLLRREVDPAHARHRRGVGRVDAECLLVGLERLRLLAVDLAQR